MDKVRVMSLCVFEGMVILAAAGELQDISKPRLEIADQHPLCFGGGAGGVLGVFKMQFSAIL